MLQMKIDQPSLIRMNRLPLVSAATLNLPFTSEIRDVPLGEAIESRVPREREIERVIERSKGRRYKYHYTYIFT